MANDGPLLLKDLFGQWYTGSPDPTVFEGLVGEQVWVSDTDVTRKEAVGIWIMKDNGVWSSLRWPDAPTGTASDASYCTEPAATSEDPNYIVNGSFTPNTGTYQVEINVEKNGVMQAPQVVTIDYSTSVYNFTVCTFTDLEGDTGTATARFYLRTKHKLSGWSPAGAWSNLVTVAYLACGRPQ